MTITTICRPWAKYFMCGVCFILHTAWAESRTQRSRSAVAIHLNTTARLVMGASALGCDLRAHKLSCRPVTSPAMYYACHLSLSLAAIKGDPLYAWHPVGCSGAMLCLHDSESHSHLKEARYQALGNGISVSLSTTEMGTIAPFAMAKLRVLKVRSSVQGCTAEVVGLGCKPRPHVFNPYTILPLLMKRLSTLSLSYY